VGGEEPAGRQRGASRLSPAGAAAVEEPHWHCRPRQPSSSSSPEPSQARLPSSTLREDGFTLSKALSGRESLSSHRVGTLFAANNAGKGQYPCPSQPGSCHGSPGVSSPRPGGLARCASVGSLAMGSSASRRATEAVTGRWEKPGIFSWTRHKPALKPPPSLYAGIALSKTTSPGFQTGFSDWVQCFPVTFLHPSHARNHQPSPGPC